MRSLDVLDLLIGIAGVVVVVAVPATGWAINRIGKTRQLETHAAIDAATEKSRAQIEAHIDKQIDGVNTRIADLTRSVQAIDAREDDTRRQLAHLQGRFEQAQQRREERR